MSKKTMMRLSHGIAHAAWCALEDFQLSGIYCLTLKAKPCIHWNQKLNWYWFCWNQNQADTMLAFHLNEYQGRRMAFKRLYVLHTVGLEWHWKQLGRSCALGDIGSYWCDCNCSFPKGRSASCFARGKEANVKIRNGSGTRIHKASGTFCLPNSSCTMEHQSRKNTAAGEARVYQFVVDERKLNPSLKVLMAWKIVMWFSWCYRTFSNCRQVWFIEQSFKKEDKLKYSNKC